MSKSIKGVAGAVLAVLSVGLCGPEAHAQVHGSGYALPSSLAIEAASEALKACEANGYQVSVAVVDTAGETRVFLKGDRSTVHTKETAFRKAYTLATLGPIFGFDTLGPFAEKMKANPFQASFLTIPNVILLPGAAAAKAKGEIVAAIGVGGAPGGEKDEACAVAGLAKFSAQLPK
jgi:uncharacterized protein GlcG (DUF336 family)